MEWRPRACDLESRSQPLQTLSLLFSEVPGQEVGMPDLSSLRRAGNTPPLETPSVAEGHFPLAETQPSEGHEH